MSISKSISKKLANSLLTVLLIATSLSGQSCTKNDRPEGACADAPDGNCTTPVTLTIWHPFEERDIYDDVIQLYTDKYPNVTIAYKKMDYATYEETLVDAIAANEGPDIFQIHNDWVPKHFDKITPMPSEIMTLDQYKERFVDVAISDLIYQDNIYSLPIYVDTLALYYNNLMLDNLKIYSPPATWQQLVDMTKKITQKTPGGNIINSAITIGTANNVNRASDILYAIMLQNSTNMTSPDDTTATFALPVKTTTGENFYPGLNSLDFYTSFADQNSPNHTWGPEMMGSLEAFEKGQAAMTINYSYQQPVIDRFKNPDIRYQITNLPQINTTDNPVSYANYWSESVNKQSRYSAWAWHFIKFMSENSRKIRSQSNRPTALRTEAEDPNNIFDGQSFYAKSWYKSDPARIDTLFNQLIEDVAVNNVNSADAIQKCQNDVTDLMIKNRS